MKIVSEQRRGRGVSKPTPEWSPMEVGFYVPTPAFLGVREHTAVMEAGTCKLIAVTGPAHDPAAEADARLFARAGVLYKLVEEALERVLPGMEGQTEPDEEIAGEFCLRAGKVLAEIGSDLTSTRPHANMNAMGDNVETPILDLHAYVVYEVVTRRFLGDDGLLVRWPCSARLMTEADAARSVDAMAGSRKEAWCIKKLLDVLFEPIRDTLTFSDLRVGNRLLDGGGTVWEIHSFYADPGDTAKQDGDVMTQLQALNNDEAGIVDVDIATLRTFARYAP